MDKLQRLKEAKKKATPTTTTTTSSTTTSTPTQQQQPDYIEDESGTIVYRKGKGDKRWQDGGFCVKCKRGIEKGEVRFFNKHQQIHARCGTCLQCKGSLAEIEIDLEALWVWCDCRKVVDFLHQC